ncbi:MAG: glycosyltransferase family 4 protein [Desulfobacterales bacterium]
MNRPLRIGILSYRSNPHCGGQGVYLKNLSRELGALGHHVEIFSGPPDPGLDPGIPVHFLNGLDLYNPLNPFRVPRWAELVRPLNLYEWINVSTMGFPEPFLFGLRAFQCLRRRIGDFDVIHDNQSLSYGIHAISRRIPTVATIHHPITVDRQIAVRSSGTAREKFKEYRWHSFLAMQRQIARRLPRIITVSAASKNDIQRDFGIAPDRFRMVPNGIDTRLFRPLPGVLRDPGRLIATNSADTPLKGLSVLLMAMKRLEEHKAVRLVVIGRPRRNGVIERMIADLDLGGRVTFTGRIGDEELVRQYARATAAVVPSLYEGFGLPVGEAMACGVPVVSTWAGALPEVVGDAGILVAPGDPDALASAISRLVDDPMKAGEIGRAGYLRVHHHFTWRRAAERTVDAYRELIDGYGGPR